MVLIHKHGILYYRSILQDTLTQLAPARLAITTMAEKGDPRHLLREKLPEFVAIIDDCIQHVRQFSSDEQTLTKYPTLRAIYNADASAKEMLKMLANLRDATGALARAVQDETPNRKRVVQMIKLTLEVLRDYEAHAYSTAQRIASYDRYLEQLKKDLGSAEARHAIFLANVKSWFKTEEGNIL